MAAERSTGMVTIAIPSPWRGLSSGKGLVRVQAATVGEALATLEERHPSIRPRLRDEKGHLRGHILVFLNSEDIRARDGESTALSDGDRLAIVPAVEGG